LFLQVLSFVVQIGIGIWLVPYLVGHLGRAAYGLIFIAGMMTQYVGLISYNISSSVNRFLTIALQRDDAADANRTFNTAFFSYLAIAILQIPVFGLVIYYANAIFTIPQELYRDAILLLICSATSFLINLMASVFGVPIYANNRLDIYRTIDIGRQVFRVVGVVALFLTFGPALRYVGYVDLMISAASCLTTAVIGNRLAPILKLNFHSYDWGKVRQLTGMGVWLLVNHLGALLFLRVDIWVCNRFVSPEAAGDYAAVLQWSNLIRLTVTVLGGVIAPMIVIYYARSEIERLIQLSKLSVRIFSLVLAIPISVLCVFSPALLSIWLGDSFARLWPLMVIMLCHLGINVGVTPLFNIQIAVNRVRWPGIVTLIMGIANLVLAIFLARYIGWGIYGVAIAGAILLTAKNALFTPIYGAIILHQPWHTFLKSYVSGLAFLAGLLTLEYTLSKYTQPASLLHLTATFLIVSLVGVIVSWFFLSKRDRRLIIDLVPGRFRSLIAKFIPV
jgi:membrane protein EpsK